VAGKQNKGVWRLSHYIIAGTKKQRPVAVARIVRGKCLSMWRRNQSAASCTGNSKAAGIYTTRLRRAAVFQTCQEASTLCAELNDYQAIWPAAGFVDGQLS